MRFLGFLAATGACLLMGPANPFVTAQSTGTITPAEGAALNYIHVRFTWPGESAATDFELQVVENDGATPFTTGSGVVSRRIRSKQPMTIVTSGLQFGHSYAWRVRGIAASGPLTWSPAHTFTTRTLPTNPVVKFTRGPSTYPPEPGLTLVVNGPAYAIDASGNIVWFLPQAGSDLHILPNGHISYFGDGRGWERTIDDQEVWTSPADPKLYMHHELFHMPNGHYLTVVRDIRDVQRNGQTQKWIGDAVVEIDPCTNKVVWGPWSAFDHFSTNDFDEQMMATPLPDNSGYDWTHANAAVYDERTDSVYVSWRHLSRITRIDHKTGKVIYDMGMAYPSGDVNFGDDLFSFQHAPQLLANGHMMVFDNGDRRKHPAQPLMSKAIELEFSGGPTPTAASIVWQWTVPEYTSFAGSARRLPGGTTLVTAADSRKVYEVDPMGQIISTLELTGPITPAGRSIYRAERVPSLFTGSTGTTPARCPQS